MHGATETARPWLRHGIAISVIALTALLVGTWFLASSVRVPPARCVEGTVALGSHCCIDGQVLERGECTGAVSHCPAELALTSGARCVLAPLRMRISSGAVEIGPSDWESQGVVEHRTVVVSAFWLDRAEFTHEQWAFCASSGACRPLTPAEPGIPVTSISAEDAIAACQYFGGRLPAEEEWIFAAATSKSQRYPWGQTGLVCRRAAFGLVDGPCAEGGQTPELSGLRAAGRTATGLYDMAGNVAELVQRQDGTWAAMGGSFRSVVAAELKSWAGVSFTGPRDDIGLRCAYDSPGKH